MSKKQKFYVVWVGVKPGIYNNWDKCLLQTKGFPNAKYKSFKTLSDAKEAFGKGYHESVSPKKSSLTSSLKNYNDVIVWNSISVDAACSGNPGKLEYQGVNTKNKDLIFHQGPFKGGTNNVGEFLALVHGLAYLNKTKNHSISIYSDSRIAIGWVKKKKANTKLAKTASNKILFELITRAENWLKKNSYTNPILKWETKRWGEIPADFGRK